MAQIFHPSTNVLSRVSIAAVVAGVPVLGVVAYFMNMSYATQIRVPREQPVEFSHRHHVAEDGIDCRYCHTSVDKGGFAGMPSSHTCMTCHSQLWTDSPELEPVRESYRTGRPIKWVRVHDLPDFVHFNHSIHVKKGVSCVSCHGRVDEMPLVWKEKDLTMAWCIDCHRKPEKALRPKERVYDLAWKPAPATHGEGEHGAAGQGEAGEHGAGAAGEHAAGGASAKGNEYAGMTQEQMGKELLDKHKILGKFQLTNCSTCHY